MAQRELSLREDNWGKRHLGIVGARKQFPLMAGDFTGGWKCHAGMTISLRKESQTLPTAALETSGDASSFDRSKP